MPGTNGLYFQDNLTQYQNGTGGTAALLAGMGISGAPVNIGAVASKNLVGMYTKTTAASGDNRALYWRHYFGAAGSGEVARIWANVAYNGVAAGGTVNGIHTTMSVDAACAVSGAGNAIRATLGAAAASRTLSGTCAALQLDSDIGAENTVPKSWSFIRVTDTNSVKLDYLLNIPAAGNSTIFATHTTQGMTHSIRIVDAAGTPYYIMCASAATNRGGSS